MRLFDKEGHEFFQIQHIDVLAAPDTATPVQRTIDVTQKVGLDLVNKATRVLADAPGDAPCRQLRKSPTPFERKKTVDDYANEDWLKKEWLVARQNSESRKLP